MSDLVVSNHELIEVLKSSLYPGASEDSVKMVLQYCKAAQLDPMQKPVHIVPMWDSKSSRLRDVVLPGVGLYRTQAARSGEYAGISEPEFGPDVTEIVGGTELTYPAWCKVTVYRFIQNQRVGFSAVERWKENYAVRGGKEKSIAPNAMWFKRPYAQLNKCAEAQALRKAFPEFGAQPTAEEMEGKETYERDITPDAPAIDISFELDAINDSTTEDELRRHYAAAYTLHTDKKTRAIIMAAYNTKKKELQNGAA